ncbi:MAG: TonB-dependent receptor [Candidatus Eremiobacteraeota bacterium]|nr:TonB-dependent receptor [Candidatus Eremiobacteraeota bacterium]MBC5826616.1 TonB-dependent receptor [Candidatus Eremiobacteraeota bacterium]
MLARTLSRFLIAGLLCAGALPVAGNAGTTGSISGRVRADGGAPLANARISVVSASQTAIATTDVRGFYSLLNMTPDTYIVTASKEGYDSASSSGITVQADQNSAADFSLHATTRVLGRIITTAQGTVVNKSVTGDLYTVGAAALNSYQGNAGGAETLYSQNGVVGSLPGVVRTIGTGGGYAGNGSLSFRGGSTDQVGFELEGIPLNRGFDAANATSFVTNGLSSLEVYTGGEPADAGRSMSGYINEVIRRGSYPGGGDLTLVGGTPSFNHTVQADVFGGTPDHKFTYYASELAVNAAYNFSNRQNLDNKVINVPAGDAGCAAFQAILTANTTDGPTFDCTVAHALNVPISQGAWQSFLNPSASERDTVVNLHLDLAHRGLHDDIQGLFVVGTTGNPFLYAGPSIDPAILSYETGYDAKGNAVWPTGYPYIGKLNQPYDPNAFGVLTWPTSGGSTGAIPKTYIDSQSTESSIEKLSFTRALSSSSFLRLYAYALYSAWNFDQATNGFLGGDYYQLHDNASGYTLNYQNQLSEKHLLRLDADYSKDLSLRYNYANNFFPAGVVSCGNLASGSLASCNPGDPVAQISSGPYAYWNKLASIVSDAAIADAFKPNEKWLFDVGARFDRFQIPLTPLQITRSNGIAEQAQNLYGTCLHGYAYAPSEPCNGYLATLGGTAIAGAARWTDVSGSLDYNDFSPRFGATYTASPRDVYRFSVGRYVQPPETFAEEYVAAPMFGSADTVSVLNNFYDGLGFLAVHNVVPQDSTNYDASYEHDFGQGLSAKFTPFARVTRGQILSIPVVPAQPTFVTGYNFGAAKIRGAEFLIRKDRQHPDGLSATLAATYTDSKIRYERALGGQNFIDVMNGAISAYNVAHGTNYATLDPNGYYSPSGTQSPTSTTPSYDVRWVANLNLDYRMRGWDVTPAFSYQSGNPYGDALNFPDSTGATSNGPDPYTNRFDAPGSLKGPSWISMNIGVAHAVGRNVKASALLTNVFTIVHNHGYPWEFPQRDQVLSYGDNSFYNNTPLGLNGLTGTASSVTTYYGDNYYPYAPSSLNPARELVFSLSTRL